MAALLLISTSHRGLFDWFSRRVCSDALTEPQPNGAVRGHKANGRHHRKPRANATDPYPSRRIAKREADDEALLAALRSNPEGSIGDWATMIHKSRTSCVSALHRLRDAGLAESVEGKWRLVVEEPAPREPPPRWTAPLSATREARTHVHA